MTRWGLVYTRVGRALCVPARVSGGGGDEHPGWCQCVTPAGLYVRTPALTSEHSRTGGVSPYAASQRLS
jgi:hypothetical protein